jgi:hypothetical protein
LMSDDRHSVDREVDVHFHFESRSSFRHLPEAPHRWTQRSRA